MFQTPGLVRPHSICPWFRWPRLPPPQPRIPPTAQVCLREAEIWDTDNHPAHAQMHSYPQKGVFSVSASPPVSLTLRMTFARWPLRRELTSLTEAADSCRGWAVDPPGEAEPHWGLTVPQPRQKHGQKGARGGHMTSQSHRHQCRGGPDAGGSKGAGWRLEGSHYRNRVAVAPYFRLSPFPPFHITRSHICPAESKKRDIFH